MSPDPIRAKPVIMAKHDRVGSGIKQLGPECNMIQLSSIAGTLYDAKGLAGIRSIVQRISVI